ncbi:rod shape-determining protein MreC [Halotalea alkalilenta]|nr:rod shape-determining protein MreC [Halotalea alkalilenta]
MRGGWPIKPLFIHGPLPGYRMLLCAVLAGALLFLDHRYTWMDQVRAEASTLVAPIQWLVSLPAEGFSWASMTFSTQRSLVEENRSLREQLVLLSQRAQRMESVSAENARLRALLKATPRDEIPYLTAELMMLDNDPFIQQMIVNRGAREGVYVGQPVIDASGVVGQVISVSRYTSRVLMISDPSHGVPVQIVRNGLRFIVQGGGGPEGLVVQNVPNNADIREGDLLVTSGLGGGFPQGYPVATVVSVQQNPNGPFARVEAQSSAQLDRSRQYLLLFARDAIAAHELVPLNQEALDAAIRVASVAQAGD